MRGREAAFDAAILALVIFIVVGSPLALGAVHPPIVAVFEFAALTLVLIWIVRAVWVPPLPAPSSGSGSSGGAGRHKLTLFGHPIVASGLGVPILLFVIVVALQLAPLPPGLIRALSPEIARLYEESLPGWGSADGVDFKRAGSFLLGPGHDAVVAKILDAKGSLPVTFAADGSALRTISIYPFATLSRLFVFLALAGLFFVVVNTVRSRSRTIFLMRLTVLLGFALSVLGILQRLSWNGRIYWLIDVDAGAEPFGPFINHNHFAAFLAMIVPVASGMLMDEARRVAPRRRGPGESNASAFAIHGPEPFARLLLAAFVVGVMVGALVLSASRGAVLALGASLLLYGAILAARRRIGRVEAGVAVALVLLAAGLSIWLGVGPLAHKLHAISDVESEPSFMSRIVGWRTTVKIIASHPLIGTGLGTFSESWAQVYPAGTSTVWHEAHNDYLQLLSETGILGFGIFLAAFGRFFWNFMLPVLFDPGHDGSFAIDGIVVGILAVALHSVVDFPLQINACAILLILLSGVLIAHRRGVKEHPA